MNISCTVSAFIYKYVFKFLERLTQSLETSNSVTFISRYVFNIRAHDSRQDL